MGSISQPVSSQLHLLTSLLCNEFRNHCISARNSAICRGIAKSLSYPPGAVDLSHELGSLGACNRDA